ncbi:MAG: nucleotide exchange factor GrpE [Candidatus Micrarchaeota archaeon]|nr:nucleotide exchange factor GrpE [Candidatus Micrarchaeota archaeon]
MKTNKQENKANEDSKTHERFAEQTEKNDYEAQIQELSNQINELKEKYMRALADYDNLKKRTQKELLTSKELGKLEFFNEILPFIDSIESARKSNHELINPLYEQLLSILKKNGIYQYPEENSLEEIEFDHNLYDVLAIMPTNDLNKDNKIAEVVKKGYRTENKIIRFSTVVVFKFNHQNNDDKNSNNVNQNQNNQKGDVNG